MNHYLRTPVARISAFAAFLGVVFTAALVAGSEIDPDVDDADAAHQVDEAATGQSAGEGHGAGEGHAAESDHGSGGSLPGLAVSDRGYSLVPDQTNLAAGRSEELRFSIQDRSGATVQEFDEMHEREMHLIAVRRDFEAFQHLHPVQAEDGSWSVDLDAGVPGTYRVFADFSVDGSSLTLATDVFVSGDADYGEFPDQASVADAGDGYEVALAAGEARVGTNPTSFEVTRNGEPVAVEPYLGADGHLVALRQHDLAFLHTHPSGDPGGGPIEFNVEYPTEGRYRLFLQFKVDGVVRTAAFSQEVRGG